MKINRTKKKCFKCKKNKHIDEFGKCKSSSDGLFSYCKKCEAKRRKEYYNRLNYREYVKRKYHELVSTKSGREAENKRKCANYIKKYNGNETFRLNEIKRVSNYIKKCTLNTNDYYIIHLLENSGFKKNILKEHPTIIEVKRSQILIKRKIKTYA